MSGLKKQRAEGKLGKRSLELCGPECWGGRRRSRASKGASRLGKLLPEVVPAHGRYTIVSLPHACLEAGLLKRVIQKKDVPTLYTDLKKVCETAWGSSPEAFLASVAGIGVTIERINECAERMPPAIIGWHGRLLDTAHADYQGHRERAVICTDVVLSVAILSRRINEIFLRGRESDLSWETLFGSSFEFDEAGISEMDLHKVPQSGKP